MVRFLPAPCGCVVASTSVITIKMVAQLSFKIHIFVSISNKCHILNASARIVRLPALVDPFSAFWVTKGGSQRKGVFEEGERK